MDSETQLAIVIPVYKNEFLKKTLAAGAGTSPLLLQAYDRQDGLPGELADVCGSRTWKITEPLQRLAALTSEKHNTRKHLPPFPGSITNP